MLCFEVSEEIDSFKNHPILTVGTKVMIGLDKTTKLIHVFTRFVDFCNENANKVLFNIDVPLRLTDIEFIHCVVLSEHETAESSALMKNDRVKVQTIRKDTRADLAETKRTQKESDRVYFEHMRNLMPDFPTMADIVLDCRGKTISSDGLNQEVLRTSVRAHSAILRKRCKWLDRIIQEAKDEFDRRSVVSIPEIDNSESKEGGSARLQRYDDDGIAPVLNYARNAPQERSGAAQIENDEDDSCSMAETSRSGSPIFSSSSGNSDMLYVTIPNHPPDAVKILLEYCYTNRVISLGREAFQSACNPMAGEDDSAVPPVNRKWPDGGKPKVSFFVALAGISIAEEAGIPRLSLMCEVAATRLIDTTHDVVEALNLCTAQEKLTGNPLTKLRKAAMLLVFQRGQRGVTDMCRTPTFRRALEEKSFLLVPSLLHGTRELVQDEKKRDLSELTELKFEELDREDQFHRELERRKYRCARRNEHPTLDDEDIAVLSKFSQFASLPNKRSKRSRNTVYFRGEARAQRSVRRKHGSGASFV